MNYTKIAWNCVSEHQNFLDFLGEDPRPLADLGGAHPARAPLFWQQVLFRGADSHFLQYSRRSKQDAVCAKYLSANWRPPFSKCWIRQVHKLLSFSKRPVSNKRSPRVKNQGHDTQNKKQDLVCNEMTTYTEGLKIRRSDISIVDSSVPEFCLVSSMYDLRPRNLINTPGVSRTFTVCECTGGFGPGGLVPGWINRIVIPWRNRYLIPSVYILNDPLIEIPGWKSGLFSTVLLNWVIPRIGGSRGGPGSPDPHLFSGRQQFFAEA